MEFLLFKHSMVIQFIYYLCQWVWNALDVVKYLKLGWFSRLVRKKMTNILKLRTESWQEVSMCVQGSFWGRHWWWGCACKRSTEAEENWAPLNLKKGRVRSSWDSVLDDINVNDAKEISIVKAGTNTFKLPLMILLVLVNIWKRKLLK